MLLRLKKYRVTIGFPQRLSSEKRLSLFIDFLKCQTRCTVLCLMLGSFAGPIYSCLLFTMKVSVMSKTVDLNSFDFNKNTLFIWQRHKKATQPYFHKSQRKATQEKLREILGQDRPET